MADTVPTISVIIPVYNRQDTVETAIASVLGQSFGDIEVIIVDDGSDPAQQFPEDMMRDRRIRLVRHNQNRGAAAARNTGARQARGIWLAWLDSDDFWDRDKLLKQVAYLDSKSDAQNIALATGYRYLYPSGDTLAKIPVASATPLHFFSGCWFCPGSTTVVSRLMFEKVDNYDTSLARFEDLDWFARFAMAGGRVESLPDILVTIGVGEKPSYKKTTQAGRMLLDKYVQDKDPVPKKYLPEGTQKNLQAYLHLEYAASAIKYEKRYFLGIRHLMRSWFLYPRIRLHLYKFWKKGS